MSEWKTVTTSRLRLRRFRNTDADFVIALVNDAAWLRFIGDRNVHTRDAAEAYIAKMNRMHAEHGHGALLIEARETGARLGMAGLFRRPGLAVPDVGFALLPAYYGHGFAREAAAAVIADAKARLRLTRIGAFTLPENTASIRLLESLGLRYECAFKLPGGSENLIYYAIEF